MARSLPRAEETHQWGDNLVYWVGDKAVGGKMFAVLNLDMDTVQRKLPPPASFSAGPEMFATLVEREGVIPAPYLARAHWVAVERWNALPSAEFATLLRQAHALTQAKLPRRVQATLALPDREYRRAVMAARKLLAAKT